MKPKIESCEREAAVLAAASSSTWDADLRAHARGCAVCQDALDIWRYLQLEAQQVQAELDESGVELPHPGLIWWRRRILDQHAAARRVLTPITLLPYVASALLFVVFAAFALWQWDALSGLLFSATSGAFGMSGASAASAGSGSQTFASLPMLPRDVLIALLAAASVPIVWSLASAWYLWSRGGASRG